MSTRATVAVGAFFLLVGVVLGAVALYLWIDPEQRRLAAAGADARAELVRKELHASRVRGSIVRPEYVAHYRFGKVAASASIDEALWRRLRPGDTLEVRVLPDDPSVHRVETQQREIVLPLVLGLIGVLFAPLGIALMRGHAPLVDRGAAWISRSPAHALGILGTVFFLPFLAGGAYWLETLRGEEELFERRARQAEGIVLSKAIVKKRSSSTTTSARRSESTHYHATYRFEADSGEEVLGTSELDAGAWEQLKERAPLAVAYVAGAPWLHRVQGWQPSWWPPILFLAVGGIGTLGCAWLAWWGRGRAHSRTQPAVFRTEVRQAPQPRAEPSSRPKRNWRWGFGAGALFFFAGCGAAVDGVSTLLEEHRYASQGTSAEARIVEKRVDEARRTERSRTQYVALYRFDTAEGAKGEGRAVLEVGAWEAARVGDRIAIRYVAGDPPRSRPAGEDNRAYGLIISIVGPLFALAGVFVARLFWLSRRDG